MNQRTRAEILKDVGRYCNVTSCDTCKLRTQSCGIEWSKPIGPWDCPSFLESPIDELEEVVDIIKGRTHTIKAEIGLDDILG